jgi:uncharacterized membrane protein YgdD (TMEM256/DUF423 family)
LWIGAVVAGLAVAAGAFGAHGLKPKLKALADGDFQPAEVFETAARYQMYHGLALVGLGLFSNHRRGCRIVDAAGWSFILGTAIFSGSLYVLATTGTRWWGAVTPIGGVGILFGWALFAWAAQSGPRP